MKLQEMIEEKKWTREQSAQKLGVSLRTMYYLVSGKTTPSHLTLKKIKSVFGVDSIEIGI